MSRQNWLRVVSLGAVLAIAALLTGLLWSISDGDSAGPKNKEPAPTTTTTVKNDQGVSQAVIDALTVKTTNVDCPSLVSSEGVPTLEDNGHTVVPYSFGYKAAANQNSNIADAMHTPFTNNDPQKMRMEAFVAICLDPLYGGTWAHEFAHMSVGNVRVIDLNPWLQPWAGDASTINDTAAGFVPLLNVTNPTVAQQELSVKQNLAWQRVAEKVLTLLRRFKVENVRAEQSILNYHLVAGGLAAGGFPEVGLNPNQENLPALVLSLTEKGACAPLKVIGLNIFDKRPEEFAPKTCQSTPPNGGVPPNTPPNGGCPPNTVPFEGRCVKAASDDGTGGNQSRYTQPVGDHAPGSTHGAPAAQPPDPAAGSGNDGTPATGPVDDSNGGGSTSVDNQPPCPFGPGNCT